MGGDVWRKTLSRKYAQYEGEPLGMTPSVISRKTGPAPSPQSSCMCRLAKRRRC